METRSIIFITTGWFPEGDAGAIRLQMMARALTEVGYNITVLCRGKLNDKSQYFGINVLSLRNRDGGKLQKLIDYLDFPNKIKRYLEQHEKELYGVYIYNAHDDVFKYCKKFCKKNNLRLFHDCVEWYSPEECRYGKLNYWYRLKERTNTKIVDDSFSVIAITKYLFNYFACKGIRTIRVPILCDSSARISGKKIKNNDRITIFYGGLPITKDLVGNLLEAALLLTKDEHDRLRFVLVGPTRDYLINVSGVKPEVIDGCSEFLELCGRVPRAAVLEKMEDADFAFLARDASMRYAQAGFPSKVVEALANATPILCNLTSDLDDYLVDGKNAIIAKDHTPVELKNALRRAMELTTWQKNVMSQNALQTAKEYFDYTNYKERIANFFD